MRTRELDDAVLHVATSQYGAFTIGQTKAIGIGRDLRRERIRQGRWIVAQGEVLVLAASPDTWRRRLMIGILVAGGDAAVYSVAALAFWGLKGFPEEPVEPRFHGTRHRLVVGRCHESRYLPEDHVRVRDGLRVVCVERALCDAAAHVPKQRLSRMVDDAILQRLTTAKKLLAMCDDLATGYRRGLKALRGVVADRLDGKRPTESELEDEFLDLVRAAGLPEPERQLGLGGSTSAGRVDFLFRPRFIAEVDGGQHRWSELQRQEDDRRDAELTAAGYLVERFTKPQIRHDPEGVIRRIWEALARAA